MSKLNQVSQIGSENTERESLSRLRTFRFEVQIVSQLFAAAGASEVLLNSRREDSLAGDFAWLESEFPAAPVKLALLSEDPWRPSGLMLSDWLALPTRETAVGAFVAHPAVLQREGGSTAIALTYRQDGIALVVHAISALRSRQRRLFEIPYYRKWYFIEQPRSLFDVLDHSTWI